MQTYSLSIDTADTGDDHYNTDAAMRRALLMVAQANPGWHITLAAHRQVLFERRPAPTVEGFDVT